MFNLQAIEIEALMLSLRVAIWSVTISLPFALATSWVLARRNFYGKFLFDALIHLPLIVPPVVVGYVLLIGFGRHGFIGSFLLVILALVALIKKKHYMNVIDLKFSVYSLIIFISFYH